MNKDSQRSAQEVLLMNIRGEFIVVKYFARMCKISQNASRRNISHREARHNLGCCCELFHGDP